MDSETLEPASTSAFARLAEQGRRLAAALLVAYGLVLAYLTLGLGTTNLPANGRLQCVPFATIALYLHKGGPEMIVNIVGNLVAFMPLGFLWPILLSGRVRAVSVLALSTAVSVLIESLQFGSGRRIADVDDVLLNALSGLMGYVGYVLARSLVRLVSPGARRAAVEG